MALDETLLTSIRNGDVLITPRLLAARKDITAYDLHKIALIFLHGDGVPQDYEKARIWFEVASAQGYKRAYTYLGGLYEHGQGVERNLATAIYHYERGLQRVLSSSADWGYYMYSKRFVDKNNASADEIYAIGVMFIHSNLMHKFEKARIWFEIACKKSHALAYRELGALYESGDGVEKSIPRAVDNYQRAVNHGCAEAETNIDNILYGVDETAATLDTLYAALDALHTEETDEETDIDDFDFAYDDIEFTLVESEKIYDKIRATEATFHTISRFYWVGYGGRWYDLHLMSDLPSDGTPLPMKMYLEERDGQLGYRVIAPDGQVIDDSLDIPVDGILTKSMVIKLRRDRIFAETSRRGHTGGVNYEKARLWLEKAIAQAFKPAHTDLCTFYEYGYGVERNLATAIYHDEMGLNAGRRGFEEYEAYYNTAINAFIYRTTASADELYAIGFMFIHSNLTHKLEKAKAWLEIASALGHALACRELGILYEFGQGVAADPVAATQYYLQGIVIGHAHAQADIEHVATLGLTEEQWNTLGDDNYDGRDGKAQNKTIARLCYEQVIRLNLNHANANLRLGKIHEHGFGANINLAEARRYYELGNHRVDLKRIERKIIGCAIQARESLDLIDDQGRTALHRAAQHKLLKLYATLLYFGANPAEIDRALQPPGALLSQEEMHKVNRLHILTSRYHNALRPSVVDIIASRITIRGANHDKVRTKAALQALYEMDSIRPLFDLAKFAMLAKHRLSSRPEVLDDGFDSDDESDVSDHQRLNIHIDPDKQTVENLVCYGADGHEGRDAVGVYVHAMPNMVYVGGNRETKTLLKGTLIHELCHFLAKEVFDNHALPYRADDELNRNRFTEIARAMEDRKDTLDPIFKAVFDGYLRGRFDAELIVRVPQFIVEQPDGLARLTNEEPELLSYYQDIFLDEVRKHTLRLEQKAAGSGWSPAVFQRTRAGAFHLQRVDEGAQSTLHDTDELDDSLAEPSTSVGIVKR